MTMHRSAPPNHLAADELRVRPQDGVSLSTMRSVRRRISRFARCHRVRGRLDVGGTGPETATVVGWWWMTFVPISATGEPHGRATVPDGKPGRCISHLSARSPQVIRSSRTVGCCWR
jgi:hypothetical protein